MWQQHGYPMVATTEYKSDVSVDLTLISLYLQGDLMAHTGCNFSIVAGAECNETEQNRTG
jgi:hypothetical protein